MTEIANPAPLVPGVEPRWLRADAVAWLELSDTEPYAVAVTALPDGPPIVLNDSARLIWLALDFPQTPLQVAARIAPHVGSSAHQLEPDISAFLTRLGEVGLAQPLA